MSERRVLYIVVCLGLLTVLLTGCAGTPALAGGGGQPAAASGLAQSGSEALAKTISVNGAGTASAQPDLAIINLGVESIQGDAGEAVSDSTTRMTAVMDVLEALEVEGKDIQTVNYSMWIEEVFDREGKPTGETRYHVVNQVSVRLHDLARTGELIQKALEAGANNVGGVSFTVADPAALKRQARDLAIADALSKAEQLAEGLGAALGGLRQVSEADGVVYPAAPSYEMGIGGGGAVPVSAGEYNVSVGIQVIFDIAE